MATAASATAPPTRRSIAPAPIRRPRRSSCSRQTGGAKFDETVELHIRLGVNVRHAEEQLRGTLALPGGLGKDVSVAVFAEGDQAKAATEAGADFVGADDLAEKVEGGWTDFDVAIATPAHDAEGRQARPRPRPQGKMPNPKVGTVTDDIAKAVGEAKAGKVEYRTDRQAIVHLSIGKPSFDESALLENYAAVIEEIIRAKPAVGEGPLPPLGHPDDDDGPRDPGRPATSPARAEILAGAGQPSRRRRRGRSRRPPREPAQPPDRYTAASHSRPRPPAGPGSGPEVRRR